MVGKLSEVKGGLYEGVVKHIVGDEAVGLVRDGHLSLNTIILRLLLWSLLLGVLYLSVEVDLLLILLRNCLQNLFDNVEKGLLELPVVDKLGKQNENQFERDACVYNLAPGKVDTDLHQADGATDRQLGVLGEHHEHIQLGHVHAEILRVHLRGCQRRIVNQLILPI